VKILAVVLAISTIAVHGWKNDKEAGMKVSVNKDIVNMLKNYVLLPDGSRAVLSCLEVPDMFGSFDDPVLSVVNMSMKKVNVNNFEVVESMFRARNANSLELALSDLRLDMNLVWTYTYGHTAFSSGTGRGYCDHSTGAVDFTLGSDKNGRPTVKISGCNFDMSNLMFKLDDDAPSWFYKAFVDAFQKDTVNVLESGICNALTGEIQSFIDKLLVQVPVQRAIDEVFSIDYSLVAPNGLAVDPGMFLVANTAGEFFPTGSQPRGLNGEIANMPNNATGSHFQIFVSEPTVISFLQTAADAGMFQKLLTKDMFSSYFADLFTTDFFAKYAPGIVTKFGNGTEVAIFAALNQVDDFMFSAKGEMGLRAPVAVSIRAKNHTTGSFDDAFILSVYCDASFVVKVDNVKIYGDINDLSAKASLVKSYVGKVDVDGFNDLIDLAISMGLDTINSYLEKGTPLPSIHVVKLVNPTIVYGEDYAVLATDISL